MFGSHASRFYLYVLAGIIAGVLIGCLAPDRLMSEARAITNMIGNGVGAIVVSARERDLDRNRLRGELATGPGAVAPLNFIRSREQTHE